MIALAAIFFDVGAGQLLHVHEERAVAVDVDDLNIRTGNFHTHGGGISEAHGTEAGRGDEGAGLVEIVILRGPHLVLPHPGGQDSLAFGQFVKLLDDVLRLDGVVRVGVTEGLRFFPGGDFVIPWLEAVEFVAFDPLEAFFGQEFVEAFEGILHVAEDRESDHLVFIQFGVVDVDVDDRSMFREFFHFAGHAVVEAHADGEEKVSFVDGVVGIDRAMHAKPLEGERMRFGEASDTHERGGHGNLGPLDELEQLGRGIRRDNTSAAIDHGLARLLDEMDHLQQLLVGRPLVRVVSPQGDCLGEDGFHFLVLDILWQVDDDRAGASGSGDMECFFDNAGNLPDIPNQVAVLDDRQGHAEEVGFLKSPSPDHFLRNLTGHGDHRHGIHEGIGQTGDEVGRAGPGGGHAEADFTCGTGVAFGGKDPALLVPRENCTDLF